MKSGPGQKAPVARVATTADDRLQVSGLVDPDNVLALRIEGERLIGARLAGGAKSLTIGLDELETASSVVLSLLLGWQRLALSEHKPLVFSGVSDRLRSLAALSGLGHHLPGF